MGDGIRDGLSDIARLERAADIVTPESLWFATKDEEETAIVRDALAMYGEAKEREGGASHGGGSSSGNALVGRKARQLAANVIAGKTRG